MRSFGRAAPVVALLLVASTVFAQAEADALVREANRREALLREQIGSGKGASAAVPVLDRARTLTQTYEDIARLFPRSAQGDDALWHGAQLAAHVYFEFGQAADKATALRLYQALEAKYPTSAFVKQIAAQVARLNEPSASRPPVPADRTVPAAPAVAAPAPRPAPAAVPAPATLTAVRREVLPGAVRVTLEIEREAQFYDERIDSPPRVFVDLYNTRAAEALRDKTITYPDDIVRAIRVGRQQDARTRVVIDVQGATRHSVYALYNPYRVIIDFERVTSARPAAAVPPPSKNRDGTFSLSRQLGLGVARVVVDPGHGGNDPGAQVRGLSEAELTLDVALRLEKLLQKQPGVDVVLTRRGDVYVSLDERTAIANRAGADLFLSIHTNASADARATGIETYVLNFATNPAAEAVAARENAGSSRTMRELPDIVKAIALNNKIDESKDFASSVQAAMVNRLKRVNARARNLGVKQAPFMVLIGATMPSVLAEISFITNPREAALLRTSRYRDQIAEALFAGVMNYQRALKKSEIAAR